MSASDFERKVAVIAWQRENGKIDALETGKRYRELCAEYLKEHAELPEGFC